jgi:hypothetical protein
MAHALGGVDAGGLLRGFEYRPPNVLYFACRAGYLAQGECAMSNTYRTVEIIHRDGSRFFVNEYTAGDSLWIPLGDEDYDTLEQAQAVIKCLVDNETVSTTIHPYPKEIRS